MKYRILKRQNMKPIYEILSEIGQTKSTNAKKDILLNNSSEQFKLFLRMMFDKSIEFGYSKIPDYTPSDDPEGYTMTNLYREMHKMHLYYKDNVEQIGERIAERQLVYLLEGLYHKDAEIVEKLIMGKLKVSGLTERLVRETYPELIPNETES